MRKRERSILSACVLLATACGDSAQGGELSGKATGSECEPTQMGAASCAGLACLQLKPNRQNKAGICSQRCSVAGDCAAGGMCVAASLAMQRYDRATVDPSPCKACPI